MTRRWSGYFERIDAHRYRPSPHAGGAWTDDELHMAPVSGAVVHAIDRFLVARESTAMTVARISFDILGKLPATDFDIDVHVTRPGRTIQLILATLTAAGRPVLAARAWLIANNDTTAITGGQPAPLPHPSGLPPASLTDLWPGGFVSSLDVRYCEKPVPGRSRTWISTEVDLILGEPTSDLARFVGLIDTANGVAVRQSPKEWMFPNVDLTIHLYRQPRDRWVGLDTTVVFGPRGHGVTSTVLHDVDGPVGTAQQMLTVRPLGRKYSTSENS